ncbi:hypothetical protein UFOVP7_48 [uncultured Caudovirales phage]|uniref:Uncharacterized protein n=1 Tax=uncultured Caudovirales phage TaxID=2100421 RepID=A0A6J5KHZ6_9CAUD|nr:hypothetical protein UFOVP7_48 [uncultured Caudovirales phage]
MATLYITEFVKQGRDGAGFPNQNATPEEPPMAEQTVAIGGSSTASATFNAKTTMLRLHCDAICSIAIAASPVATATNRRLAANTTEYIALPANSSFKVAVITNT